MTGALIPDADGRYKRPQGVPERDYHLNTAGLVWDLTGQTHAKVVTTYTVIPTSAGETPPPFCLQGDPQLQVDAITINGTTVNLTEIERIPGQNGDLTRYVLPGFTEPSIVVIHTTLDATNKEPEGLFKSGETVLTQGETLGFGKITLFPDLNLPGVQYPTWRSTVVAPVKQYPTVIATGDQVARMEVDGTVTATFASDVPMPAYLYAMVAGNLVSDASTQKVIRTKEGKEVSLKVYCSPGDQPKCQYALQALSAALEWDEETFGLAYPLSEYKIVIVTNFNHGGMENMGCTVLSAKYGLADPSTATDFRTLDLMRTTIHEVLHTQSGNAVPIVSWHDIALKEGLNVRREQMFLEHFIGDVPGRIMYIKKLRSMQNPEDIGNPIPLIADEYTGDPMSNGMYKLTRYYKSAEVVRMLQILLDQPTAGIARFLKEFQGRGTQFEDLITTMEQTTGKTFPQFRNWLRQRGTVHCDVASSYNSAERTLTLTVGQRCEHPPHEPLQFPLMMGLIGPDGNEVPLGLVPAADDHGAHDLARGMLVIQNSTQTFTFKNVPEGTVPSLLRSYSGRYPVYWTGSMKSCKISL